MLILKIIGVLLKIIGILLLIVLLAMCIPVHLGVLYEQTVIVRIRYLFFRYTFDSASLKEEPPDAEQPKAKNPGPLRKALRTALTAVAGVAAWLWTIIKRGFSLIMTSLKRGAAFVKKKCIRPKPKKPSEEDETPKKKRKAQSLFGSLREDRGFWGAIKFFADLGLALGGALVRVYRGVAVDRFTLRVAVAGEDAADTAIKYGEVCSAAFPMLSFLLTHARRYQQDITVTPDFAGDGNHIVFDGAFTLYPILLLGHLLGAVIGFVIAQIKFYITKKTNEKKG